MALEDELPYRGSGIAQTFAVPKDTASSDDERDLSTLKVVKKLLAESIDSLGKDFNAFELLKNKSNKVALESLYREIQGRQIAYDILVPLFETIDKTIEQVDKKYRSK